LPALPPPPPRSVSRNLTALTDLNLCLCDGVTTEGLRAVSRLTALTKLNLTYCSSVTSEGLQH
jgi:hypothetical protein